MYSPCGNLLPDSVTETETTSTLLHSRAIVGLHQVGYAMGNAADRQADMQRIRRRTRKRCSADEKISIGLEGLKGEDITPTLTRPGAKLLPPLPEDTPCEALLHTASAESGHWREQRTPYTGTTAFPIFFC